MERKRRKTYETKQPNCPICYPDPCVGNHDWASLVKVYSGLSQGGAVIEREAPLPSTHAEIPVIESTISKVENTAGDDQREESVNGPTSVTEPIGTPPRQVHASAKLKRQRKSPMLARLVLAAALSLLIVGVGGVAFDATFTATVFITPITYTQERNIPISAVVSAKPNPEESQARLLTNTLTSPPQITPAMGSVKVPAVPARGTLTFYNQNPSAQHLPSGIVISVSPGLQLATDAPVDIPPENPPDLGKSAPVPAHAVQAGSIGNIASGIMHGLCSPCGTNVAASNAQFTGGSDATDQTVVTQQDVDRVGHPLVLSTTQRASAAVQGQKAPGEKLLTPPVCKPLLASEPAVGRAVSAGTQVRVTATVTCTAEAISPRDVQARAEVLFWKQVPLHPNSQLLSQRGQATTRLMPGGKTDGRGALQMIVKVRGSWVCQVSRLLLARQLAGQPVSEASRRLSHAPGVQDASIQTDFLPGIPLPKDWVRLPDDPGRITFVFR